ncbi:kinase D-interacting substrate of 220 kDa [Lingula anatina]|uniref:Kinase D-interacting substrate of 220 kDa n=1 Tax=Lingula anatina TaxID=7574 RepID=A0A2R2MJF0_LINAN|nr:kinase D-interacting substrate of 220 kDa [Lingula anatina]|eukprot:XP_023930333.1 kinase D-interacting substrate of 220 kDa [Lingula anatina]
MVLAGLSATAPAMKTCSDCESTLGYHALRQIAEVIISDVTHPVVYMCCSESTSGSAAPYQEESWQQHLDHLKASVTSAKPWIWILDVRTKPGEEYSAAKHGPEDILEAAVQRRIDIHRLLVIYESSQHDWRAAHLIQDSQVRWSDEIRPPPTDLLRAPFREDQVDELPEEVKVWLKKETDKNRNSGPVEFWHPIEEHDPRGVASYVNQHIKPWLKAKKTKRSQKGHPHPSIVKFYEDHKYESVGGVISDHGGMKDALDYERYAEVLSEVLRDRKLSMPVTVGIQGSWGVGKTFLLNLLEYHLRKTDAGSEEVTPSCSKLGHDQRQNVCIFFFLSFVLTCLITAGTMAAMITTHLLFPGPAANLTSSNSTASTPEFRPDDNIPLLTYLSFIAVIIIVFLISCVHYGGSGHWSLSDNWTALKQFLILLFTVAPRNLTPSVPPSQKPQIILVKFNAWEYAGSDFLWAGIITHLCDQVEQSFGLWTTRCFRLVHHHVLTSDLSEDTTRDSLLDSMIEQRGNRREEAGQPDTVTGDTAQRDPRSEQLHLRKTCCMPSFLFSLLCTGFLLVSVTMVILSATSSSKYGATEKNIVIEAVFGTFVSLTVLYKLKVVIRLMRAVWRSQKSRIQRLQLRMTRANFDEELGFMYRVKKEVEVVTKLINYMQWLHGKMYRFVIFVDDLDRCEEKKIVKMLEAVNILLSDPNSSFISVLAIDPRLIVKSIEHSYGDRLTEANVSGYEYLKKIITLPFSLSPANPEDTKHLITSYLERIKREEQTEIVHSQKEVKNSINTVKGKKGEKSVKTYQGQGSDGTISGSPKKGVYIKLRTVKKKTAPEKKEQDAALDVTDAGPSNLPAQDRADARKYQNCLEISLESLMTGKMLHWLNSNPRSIKRITNILNLVLKLYVAELRDLMEEDTRKKIRKLTAWVVFTEQWPYRASRIIHHYKAAEDRDQDVLLENVDVNCPHPSDWKSMLKLMCLVFYRSECATGEGCCELSSPLRLEVFVKVDVSCILQIRMCYWRMLM